MNRFVGSAIRVTHEVRDLDGDLADAATVTLTVTLPDLTTDQPSVDNPPESTGSYEVEYTLEQAGRYVFSWQTTDPDTADASAVEVVEPNNRPTLDKVKTYLGDAGGQWSDAEIQDALDAETAAQAVECEIEAEYPASLGQALKRRVQRNLAMRPLSLAVLTGDAEEGGSSLVLPGRDPEVRRLEAPYRAVVIV